jgi:hypothetical protein
MSPTLYADGGAAMSSVDGAALAPWASACDRAPSPRQRLAANAVD